ncbi:MAG: primosomal protein N' [Deltaproteobacteria bacterium]|nr:primosomal protein N' [Deltaproteobacteria bacterium]
MRASCAQDGGEVNGDGINRDRVDGKEVPTISDGTQRASTAPSFCEVLVPLPLEGHFHYRVPEHLRGDLIIGHRVLVPFGSRSMTGFVVGLSETAPAEVPIAKIRAIQARLDPDPVVPPDVLSLVQFAARYYLAAAGEVLKGALPPGLSATSTMRYVITAEGRRRLDPQILQGLTNQHPSLSVAERRNLARTAAADRQGLKIGAVSEKAMMRLESLGLVEKRQRLAAKAVEATRSVVRLRSAPKTTPPDHDLQDKAQTIHDKALQAVLGRSRIRQRVHAALQAGAKSMEDLETLVGRTGARAAVKHLAAAGWVEVELESVRHAQDDRGQAPIASAPPMTTMQLTEAQDAACTAIGHAIEANAGGTFLLHGVTGSGKTEVYLQCIAKSRARGRGAIVLVPEIALTPQLEQRFRSRFGGDVVVLHSALRDKQRRDGWNRLRRGEASIALGPRSTIWAPVQNVGIIVVDEEHDPSFKQSSDVRYNGRDLALVRARETGSVAILGSATPSLESMHLAELGRIQTLELATRVGGQSMPRVEIIDLADERRAMGRDEVLSRRLIDALRSTVEAKKQAIIFLNRRGFNTIAFCDDCGDAKKCPHCEVSLTHHKQGARLRCHHCGFDEPLRARCRTCAGTAVAVFGAGTERVAETVAASVPGAKVLRLDRDITEQRGGLDETLEAFRAQEANILVGTQMVAKGHDFPEVMLVGVVLADASLGLPDFRAAERTFQLLTQVAGRAGRRDGQGHVIIQTFQPKHYAIQSAVTHDTHGFFALERRGRQSLGYPPFGRVGLIRVESRDEQAALATARRIGETAGATRDPQGRVLGPSPAPISKLRDRFRFILILFAPTPARLVAFMMRVKGQTPPATNVDIVFDVDPMDLL